MPITEGDVIRVSAQWKDQFLSDVVNVFYVQVSAVVDADDFAWEGMIRDWVETMYLEILPHVAPSLVTNLISMFHETDNRPLSSGSWPSITAGTSSNTEVLPAGVAGLLVGRTGVSRRVAKKYLPPFTEGSLVVGRMGSGALAAMNSMADEWVAGESSLLVGTFVPGVFAPGAPGFAQITSAYASPEPAYQRRRRPGRGS